MSKTIQNYIDKHPDKFKSWHSEDHNDRGLDYWIYCNNDWFCPRNETQTIHVDTVKEALAEMRHVEQGYYNGWCWTR